MIPIPQQFAAVLVAASLLLSAITAQGLRACDRDDGCAGCPGASARTDAPGPQLPEEGPVEYPQQDTHGDSEVEEWLCQRRASLALEDPARRLHPEAHGARLERRAHKFFRPPKHLI